MTRFDPLARSLRDATDIADKLTERVLLNLGVLGLADLMRALLGRHGRGDEDAERVFCGITEDDERFLRIVRSIREHRGAQIVSGGGHAPVYRPIRRGWQLASATNVFPALSRTSSGRDRLVVQWTGWTD